MKLPLWTVFVFCGVLLLFVQLVAAFMPVTVAVLASVAIGFLVFLLPDFFLAKVEAWWPPVALALGASLGGTLLRLMSKRPASLWLILAPAFALLTSAAIAMYQRQFAQRCGLCNLRLAGDPALECPRCGLTVCDRDCWDFDHCRCHLCETNRVPIFTPDARWWDRQFGPRIEYGRCQVCLAPAAEANLRACAKCGRAECIACWDYGNGQCTHCGWVVSDLPNKLKMYVSAPAQAPAGSSRKVAHG